MPGSIINDGFHVHLPESVRTFLGVTPGDYIEFHFTDHGTIQLMKAQRPDDGNVLFSSNHVQLPSPVRRHLEVDQGQRVEYLDVRARTAAERPRVLLENAGSERRAPSIRRARQFENKVSPGTRMFTSVGFWEPDE